MKKKTFYQTNIGWQILCFTALVIFVVGVVVAIQMSINFTEDITVNRASLKDWCRLILQCFAPLGFLQCFITLERFNVILNQEKVYMKEQWSHQNSRTQFYSEVKFVDIESVDIIWTNRNSMGGKIKSLNPHSNVAKRYLSIKNKKGGNINFFITYMQKKDVLKLIDEIQARMKAVGNDKVLINKEQALEKLVRKTVLMDE